MLAAAAAALVLAAPLQARTTPHHRWSSMTLRERRAVVQHQIRRQRAPIRAWLLSRELSDATVYRYCRALGTSTPGVVCEHGQRLVHALGVLRRIDARLAAQARPAGPAHLAGWLCIHDGRHPGAPGNVHEGRGRSPNGLYSGPLQMSNGWGGYPVSDWDALSDEQVYADAETVAAANGFSPAWMSGQWPMTFPPCAEFFR